MRWISLALSCSDMSLGIRALAKIPMMTITISISMSVNHLFFCMICVITEQKKVSNIFLRFTCVFILAYEINL